MHQPVLLEEVIRLLAVRDGGVYVDGTLGSGGHAEAILERIGVNGVLFGIDRDGEALARSGHRLARFGARFRPLRGNIAEMGSLVRGTGVERVDGVLMDLGVSSEQLDTPVRGFSFMHDGPLDMRMDTRQALTAAEVVNTWPEREMSRIFYKLGEERQARRIARVIALRRDEHPFTTTSDLAGVIAAATGGRRGRLHPATRAFQALRMTVNGELEGIIGGLNAGLALLKDNGRMAVISFHSLEDRCVKHFFTEHEGRWLSQAAGGEVWEGQQPPLRRVTRKPVCPTQAECECNARARSSKLRVVERTAVPVKTRRN